MLTLEDFKTSKTGEAIGELLDRDEIKRAMKALSREGRPAVLALDAALPADARLGRNEKQHVGRMIRDRLADDGWRVAARRPFRGGRIFSSGAVYRQLSQNPPPQDVDTPPPSDWSQQIAAAQALVRSFSTNNYSVDDFIADKRRETAREEERWR